MKAYKGIAALLMVAIGATLFSCSGSREDTVLAEIGDREVKILDFEEAWHNVGLEYLPPTTDQEGAKQFLETIVQKEILAHKADDLGYDKDPTVIQGMQAYHQMGLQAGYLKVMVSDNVEVTDAEVKEHYRNRGAVLSVKQILVDTPTDADEAIARLEDGDDFDTVLREMSKAPDAAEGGTVVTVNYGSYVPEMQNSLFALDIGQHTQPIQTPYGWFIMKVLRRTEARDKEPFEQIEPTVRQEWFVLKEMVMVNQHTEKIRRDHKVTWYWDNLGTAYRALPADRSMANPPTRDEEVYPLLYFEAEDLDLPMVTYELNGKTETIAIRNFSDLYDRASFFTRPRRDARLGGIKSFLTQIVMNELVASEMTASNIEEHPTVQRALKRKREELMVGRLYDDQVTKVIEIPNDEMMSYYRENKNQFTSPETRRFAMVLTGDQATAQKAYDELRSGRKMRQVVLEYSIDPETRETLGETPLITKGENPDLDATGFSLPRVGAISEPFETGRGWMVVRVTEIQPERVYSYEESVSSITTVLRQQKSEERLQELLAKWREEYNVTIYEDRLGKCQLEDRRATAAAVHRDEA